MMRTIVAPTLSMGRGDGNGEWGMVVGSGDVVPTDSPRSHPDLGYIP